MSQIGAVSNIEGKIETGGSFSLATVGIKMKSREAVTKLLFGVVLPDVISCADLHNISLSMALSMLNSTEQAAYGKLTARLEFEPDEDYHTGLWDFSKIVVNNTQDDVIKLRAPKFLTAPWIPRLGGMFYCKLVYPESIVEWIQSQMNDSRYHQ